MLSNDIHPLISFQETSSDLKMPQITLVEADFATQHADKASGH
jgi:hypothetical protein